MLTIPPGSQSGPSVPENTRNNEIESGGVENHGVSNDVQNANKSNNKIVIPKGAFKSGRIWKSEKKRFKSIRKTKGIEKGNALEKQMKLRNDLKRIKTISKAREEQRKEESEELKERRRKNLERQKVNQQKSEVVQVIKNSSKIKRMKKKQLKSIEKRDVTKVSTKK